MNSLSIRHISPRMRILLINNSGGAVMYDQCRNTPAEKLPIYLAAGEKKSARGWVESLGFKYLAAYNKEDVDKGVDALLDDSVNQPVVLEVFTKLCDDRFCVDDYVASQDQRTFGEKVYGRVSRMLKR